VAVAVVVVVEEVALGDVEEDAVEDTDMEGENDTHWHGFKGQKYCIMNEWNELMMMPKAKGKCQQILSSKFLSALISFNISQID
jgi:hypothetical protein